MVIDGLSAYGSAANNSGSTKKADESMGKDAFLKLLVTQLENQDPLNPTDNTEFVAQLAQFSSLEGITNLNTSMDGMSENMTALQNYGSTSLIGRFVKAEGSRFEYSNSPVEIGYSLPEDSSSAVLTITNSSGKVVRDVDLGPVKAGSYETSWDGRDNSGAEVTQGSYGFSVEARNKKTLVETKTYVTGPVTGVSLDSGIADLVVGGSPVSRDKVREIY